jgi:MSHA biogenesis protein MshJ
VTARAHIKLGLDWFDAQSARQRALLLGGALALVLGGWNLILMAPVSQARALAAGDLTTVTSELAALTDRAAHLETALKNDPNAAARERRAALEEQRLLLDRRLAELTEGLIPPAEMAGALRELLRGASGVSLVKLEALPAEPLFVEAPSETPAEARPPPGVFKHAVVIELRGSYLGILRYVQVVEELRWRFFWDSLDYEVEEHPAARVRLTLYSLSLREGWLGV